MNWKTEKRKLKDLVLLDNNPRTITKENFQLLKQDLERVGNFRPLVIDTNNVVLAGNQRYRVLQAKHGGDYEVEVSVPDKELSEKERKQVIILDNKHRGKDDVDILANEFEDVLEEIGAGDLMLEDIDFDDIESTEDRERKFKDMDVICPHCGETFKIKV